MFEIHLEKKSLKFPIQQIVAIIESINSPMVAAANKPLEPAKAFIMGVRNSSGSFSIYIYLHLLQSRECMIYLHDSGEIPMESYHETELEAIQFVESMGFMLDNINFRDMQPEQQFNFIEKCPMFFEDLEEFSKLNPATQQDEQKDTGKEAYASFSDEEIIELEEVAGETKDEPPQKQVVSDKDLVKIIRLLSSF